MHISKNILYVIIIIIQFATCKEEEKFFSLLDNLVSHKAKQETTGNNSTGLYDLYVNLFIFNFYCMFYIRKNECHYKEYMEPTVHKSYK